jgi:glucose dehydrogenase
MTLKHFVALTALIGVSIVVGNAQGSDPDGWPDGWPTYNGDYSGRRYSPLKQINASNVRALTLAWMYAFRAFRSGASANLRSSRRR